jgi:hypothetical protein
MVLEDSLATYTQATGWPLILVGVIFVWSLVWKLLAMWKAARKGSPVWFIVLSIINTVGILEILYIYVFSKLSGEDQSKQSRDKAKEKISMKKKSNSRKKVRKK